jgi:hypothetical protein
MQVNRFRIDGVMSKDDLPRPLKCRGYLRMLARRSPVIDYRPQKYDGMSSAGKGGGTGSGQDGIPT